MFDTIIRVTDTRSGAAQSFRFAGRSPIGSILWLLSLLFLLSGLIPLGAAEQSSSPSIATRFLYDADGQRVGKQTVRWDEGEQGWRTNLTRFLIDPQHPSGYAQRLAEAGEAGEAGEGDRAYLHGLHPIAEVTPDRARYALVDGHRSLRGQVEEGGGLAGRRDYDAFGSQLAGELTTTRETDSEAVGYAGEFYDSASGLQDLRARQYEPLLGRFRTMDSFEGRQEFPAGQHKFVYCENEPVNGRDPSGHMSLTDVNASMGNIASLAQMSFRVLGSINRARGIFDAIQTLQSMLGVVQGGSVFAHMESAMSGFGPGFDPQRAISSFEDNYQRLFTRSFPVWSAFLGQHGNRLKGLIVYMPTPQSPLGQIPMPAGKINNLNITLMFGGAKHAGRVIGIGLNIPGIAGFNDRQQIWRMDYHPFHGASGQTWSRKDSISTWLDGNFHYHVLRPQQ